MLGADGYLVVSLLVVLGVQLLALAVRTRRLPELWIGLFFLCTAPGAGLMLAVLEQWKRGVAVEWMVQLGLPLISLGTICCYLFTCSTFRSGQRWAQGLAAAGSALCLWGCFTQLGGLSGQLDSGRPHLSFVLARVLCFGWATYEALRLYRMMRRRRALGLGDPVVANRFLLFAVWSGSMGVLPMVHGLDRLLGGPVGYQRLLAIFPKSIGTVMLASIVLTFFPPRAYLRWLRGAQPAEPMR